MLLSILEPGQLPEGRLHISVCFVLLGIPLEIASSGGDLQGVSPDTEEIPGSFVFTST